MARDPRATVCLTFDFDAVSAWIHIDPEQNTPTNRSRGRFGAEVATPRLLELLGDHGLETTWFVPGHTLDSFPDVSEEVYARGHEIQHHGWSHTPPGDYDSRAAEREDVVRGMESVAAVTGSEPEGYRSPSWDYSEHTVDLLAELGFEWSSSGMAREYEPYPVRRDSAPADEAYELGKEVGLLEVPVSWQRDDFPALAFTGNRGFADEGAVFESWRRQFDWMYEHVDGGVYVLTMHPQVIGQSHRLDRLEDLICHFRGRPGVEFAQVSDVVARY